VHNEIRWNEIEELVTEVDTPFLLMTDTAEAFDHAIANNWI